MAIRSDRLMVSLISSQGHYTFLYGHTKHNREGGRKEQTNKHGSGSAPNARGGSLWHFCAALRAFAGNRGRILARNFHKATRNADSSYDCPVLTTGLFRSLLLTVLFSPPLSTDPLGSSFPPLLSVSLEISPSGPLCEFRAKTHKGIL